VILVSLLICYCERTDQALTLHQNPKLKQFRSICIQQLDYDRLVVASAAPIHYSERFLRYILFTYQQYDGKAVRDTIFPQYNDSNTFTYQFAKKIRRSPLKLSLSFRFVFDDQTFFRTDSVYNLLNYPYPSTEVFIRSQHISTQWTSFQDFELQDTLLLFHPTGAHGLYRYNLESGNLDQLVPYTSGNYMAYAPGYIFYEQQGERIKRYNLQSGKTDLEFKLDNLAFQFISGMAASQDHVYVLFQDLQRNYLAVFDLDGAYHKSIPYPKRAYFLTLADSLLYSARRKDRLICFDLRTETICDSLLLPSNETEGFCIDENYFYFADFYKRIIGHVPLADMRRPE